MKNANLRPSRVIPSLRGAIATKQPQQSRVIPSLRGAIATKQPQQKPLIYILITFLLLLTAGCANSKAVTNIPEADLQTLVAVKTASAPAIDGNPGDAAWKAAQATTVTLKAESGVESREITVRALYDAKNVYILADYRDSTPLKIGEVWTFDGTNWAKGAYDDTLAFVWNMGEGFPDFEEKGMGVMTTPLKNGMDVFDFTIDNPSTALLHAKLDFWGW